MKDGHFLKLFLKHENALRSFARSLLPSWSNVDDVLQEGGEHRLERVRLLVLRVREVLLQVLKLHTRGASGVLTFERT